MHSSHLKTTSIITGVLLSLVVLASQSVAAPKGTTRLHIPSDIIKGSKVTSNRAFYKTDLPENGLAGIRLGRKAKEILKAWGNPTRITIGTAKAKVTEQPSLPGLPGLPGLSGPSQNNQSEKKTQTISQEEVTWTYDLPNGITLEFIVTEEIITQITVGGVGPWGLSKTRTGVQLGDTYKLVLWVYGYPENQRYIGKFLRVSYVNKHRVLFTFLENKLVGVTIAMVPDELQL